MAITAFRRFSGRPASALVAAALAVAAAVQATMPASAALSFSAQATNWRYLAVPLYHQTHGLSCEAAALQMALASLGINVSQDTILNESPIDYRGAYYDYSGAFHWGDPYAAFVGNPDGSERGLTGYGEYYPPIAKVAQAHGAVIQQQGEGIAPSTLYQAVLNGHPVVAWTSFDWAYHQVSHYAAFDGRTVQFGSPYEHAVTIAGVTSGWVLINNPWYGAQWISKPTFEASYATFNHMAIIFGGAAVGPGISTASTTFSGATPVPADSYRPLAPARILDTRNGTGVPRRPLPAGGHVDVPVAGQGGVPLSGADVVVLNVTATNTGAPGFLTVYPSGGTPPAASNLNWQAGQTVSNLVTVQLGAGGMVSAYAGGSQVDVVFDVQGWYGPSPTTTHDGLFNVLTPARLLDTRNSGGPLYAGQTRTLTIAGRGGVPASGVAAVALNVAVTDGTASSYVSVYPAGSAAPSTSNLNFVAGEQLANRVIVPLGAGGAVTIFNASGRVNVVVDVGGWFTDATTVVGGSRFAAIPVQRMLDTRNGFGAIPEGGIAAIAFSDTAAIGVTAIVANFTIVGASQPSYLTVWPAGSSQPVASDLNYALGQTVANLVIARIGSGGFDVYNYYGRPHLVIDLAGYYGPVAPPA